MPSCADRPERGAQQHLISPARGVNKPLAIGTLIGAAAGAAIGGGQGAAVGAGVGLAGGALAGTSTALNDAHDATRP